MNKTVIIEINTVLSIKYMYIDHYKLRVNKMINL